MEKYKFEKKDVLWCQLENWYPIFKRFCPKTEFFQLDKVEISPFSGVYSYLFRLH